MTMTTTTTKKKVTITLTDRPPVTVTDELWPIVATAEDEWCDNQYRFQAFRTTDYLVRVRQHADGRAIVYAEYDYATAWQGESSRRYRTGRLLDDADTDALCKAIHGVTDEMVWAEYGDRETWGRLAQECIADLPPEVLD